MNVIVYLSGGDVRDKFDLIGTDVVLVAIYKLKGRNHIIITDNFFT